MSKMTACDHPSKPERSSLWSSALYRVPEICRVLEQSMLHPTCRNTKSTSSPTQHQHEFLDDDVAVADDGSNDERDQILMFFYFECNKDDGQHIPNLCVVQNKNGDEKLFLGRNN